MCLCGKSGLRQDGDLAGEMPQLDPDAFAHKLAGQADGGLVGGRVDEVGSAEVSVVSDGEGTICHDEAPGEGGSKRTLSHR